MAHIPMDDIRELWSSIGSQHSWKALSQNLESRKSTTQGIANNLVDVMLMISHNEEKANHSFPQTADQLYDLLNQQYQKMSQ